MVKTFRLRSYLPAFELMGKEINFLLSPPVTSLRKWERVLRYKNIVWWRWGREIAHTIACCNTRNPSPPKPSVKSKALDERDKRTYKEQPFIRRRFIGVFCSSWRSLHKRRVTREVGRKDPFGPRTVWIKIIVFQRSTKTFTALPWNFFSTIFDGYQHFLD